MRKNEEGKTSLELSIKGKDLSLSLHSNDIESVIKNMVKWIFECKPENLKYKKLTKEE